MGRDIEVYKDQILALQKDKNLYYNGTDLMTENGGSIHSDSDDLDWTELEKLTLGKCGELYAHYILNKSGFQTYESLVDDHGIDLIARRDNNSYFKVQVKAVKEGGYAFIRKDNPIIDKDFYLFFVCVNKKGKPRAFFFPMKPIVDKLNNKDKAKYLCFTFHEYKEKKSKPEYGVSASQKFFGIEGAHKEEVDYYCVGNAWEPIKQQFIKIFEIEEIQ